MGKAFIWGSIALLGLSACQKKQENLNIAVASSMANVAQQAADILKERHSKCRISLSIAGSSSLFNNFSQGADYHIFMGADEKWPLKFKEALSLSFEPYIYAKGQALLWLKDSNEVNKQTEIVISNHQSTPYGQAAYNWLKSEGLWEELFENKKVITAGSAAKVSFVTLQGGFKQAILPQAFLSQLPQGYSVQSVAEMQHFMINLKTTPCQQIWQNFIEKDEAFEQILIQQHYQKP